MVLCYILGCSGCGSSNETKEDDSASASLGGTLNAVQEMAKQAEETQQNGPVETVDFRKLKDMLPADAAGLTRKSANGEKNGMGGFTFSTATGEYENEDNSQNIDLAIVDTGGSGAMMGMAAWSMIEMDKETESGYEKTTKIGDNKAFEKYDNANKSGEVAVLVKNRYIITVKGRGVEMAKIKSVLDDVDLEKLGAMK
ncbi:transposase [Fibrella sp. HMF5405]|uniref:Transposase n=2 Tax=Fibrella forsythiae TaxID=2817061 RepID=A0ABS3JD50_9BACT|nr:transposase [Fibrella forsythiae]